MTSSSFPLLLPHPSLTYVYLRSIITVRTTMMSTFVVQQRDRREEGEARREEKEAIDERRRDREDEGVEERDAKRRRGGDVDVAQLLLFTHVCNATFQVLPPLPFSNPPLLPLLPSYLLSSPISLCQCSPFFLTQAPMLLKRMDLLTLALVCKPLLHALSKVISKSFAFR